MNNIFLLIGHFKLTFESENYPEVTEWVNADYLTK